LQPALSQDHAELLELVRGKAANLFATGEMLCAPAVLVTLNHAFQGGLDEGQARTLAAALPEGMGGAGCTCGALSGAQLALGLFLGENATWRKMAPKAREMHDIFKGHFGSTCCRVLSKKVRHDPKAHMAQCTGFTGEAAVQAAQIILAAKPELAEAAGISSLRNRTNWWAVRFRKLVAVVNGRF
jgi:C_GCAxxG_C_C family probable redox protein